MTVKKAFLIIFNILDYACSSIVTPYIIYITLKRFLTMRRKRWAKPVLYIGCVIFTGTAILVGDTVNIFGAMLTIFITVFICFEGPCLQRFSMSLIFSNLGISFNALIDSYIRYNLALSSKLNYWQPNYGILVMLISLAIYAALKKFAPKQGYCLPSKLWALMDFLTLAPFTTTFTTVIMGNLGNTSLRDIILLTAAALVSFGLLWAVAILAQVFELEQEKSFYRINRMYYKNLEQEQFQVRCLRHDMANHLQTMSVMPEPELRKYLNELIKSPAMEHTHVFCGNNVVNIVLASKEALMKQNKIGADIKVSVPQKIAVKDAELCALFSNSLDNAIEACKKLPENQRNISIQAVTEKGLFVLQVQNPEIEKAVFAHGFPITTKLNTKGHGFGLAAIRDIAERYEGTVEISENNGNFTLLVYFRIEDM